MRKLLTLVWLLVLAAPAFAAPKDYTLASPDGKLSVKVVVGDDIRYTLTHGQTVLLENAQVAMKMTDGVVFGAGDKVRKAVRKSVDQTLLPVVYKKNEVRDHYNELTLQFKEFNLIFRAYDAGVAYRFVSVLKGACEVAAEQADFAFPADWTGFIPYVRDFDENDFTRQYWNSFENLYVHIPLSQWDKRRLAFLPLALTGAGTSTVSLTNPR